MIQVIAIKGNNTERNITSLNLFMVHNIFPSHGFVTISIFVIHIRAVNFCLQVGVRWSGSHRDLSLAFATRFS